MAGNSPVISHGSAKSISGIPQLEPRVREAKFPDDFEAIVEVSRKAFIHDPCFMFFGQVVEITPTGLKDKNDKGLRNFVKFILSYCIDLKARITVVVLPEFESESEKIVAATFWCPPGKRVEVYQVGRLLRCGITKVVKSWGLTGIDRVTRQYMDLCHHEMAEGYKRRSLKPDVKNSWYLNLAVTEPVYQGRGFMSMLMREQFTFAPDAFYTLEATTEKTKDQYAHFGFELQKTFKMGVGRTGKNGLPAVGEDATGIEVFPMVKWPPSVLKAEEEKAKTTS